MQETNKVISIVGYFIFFVPLLIDSKNETYRFHSGQALNLLLLSLAINIVGSIIPIIGTFVILPLGGLLCLVLLVMGILNVVNDELKELPLIGQFKLIK